MSDLVDALVISAPQFIAIWVVVSIAGGLAVATLCAQIAYFLERRDGRSPVQLVSSGKGSGR